MRFSLAREAGLTEAIAADIDDGFEASNLADSWKAALALTDHMINGAGPPPPSLRADLDRHFDPGDQVELGLGIALFHGFSKMLIALGLEPDEMDTTILDTPAPLGHSVAPAKGDDPHLALLALRPDLADRWAQMTTELWSLAGDQAGALDLARTRVAALLGVEWATAPMGPRSAAGLEAAVQEIAELFVLDVRAITPTHRANLAALTDQASVVQLVMALAVYDGIYRLASLSAEGVPT